MKKSIFTFLFGLLFTAAAFGQINEGSRTPTFTIKQLDEMNKLELANIYVVQMKRLVEMLPFVAFNQYGMDTDADLGIPKTTFNLTALSQIDSAVTGHNSTMEEVLPNVIPFSDKTKIIEGILFLQRNIEVIENGMK